jgi:hypothetical protein
VAQERGVRDQVVVHAQIVDSLGMVTTRSGGAQLRPDRFKRVHHVSRLNLRHDKTQPVATLAALERSRDGVWATWTSRELALLTLTDVYVSGEVTWRGRDSDAQEVEVTGAALVEETASSCTRPALILCGDLLNERDRKRWRNLPQPARDRLERAATDLERRNKRGDDVIDLRDEIESRALRRQVEHENLNRSPLPIRATRGNEHLIPPQSRAGFRRGDVEWSAHRGRVLHVVR